jgi:hypothetical protein
MSKTRERRISQLEDSPIVEGEKSGLHLHSSDEEADDERENDGCYFNRAAKRESCMRAQESPEQETCRKYSKTKARIVTGNKYYYEEGGVGATAKKSCYQDE